MCACSNAAPEIEYGSFNGISRHIFPFFALHNLISRHSVPSLVCSWAEDALDIAELDTDSHHWAQSHQNFTQLSFTLGPKKQRRKNTVKHCIIYGSNWRREAWCACSPRATPLTESIQNVAMICETDACSDH